MRSPSGPTRRVLQLLRQSCVTVSAHCDVITFDGETNVANSLRRLPNALRLLQQRVEAAIAALESERGP